MIFCSAGVLWWHSGQIYDNISRIRLGGITSEAGLPSPSHDAVLFPLERKRKADGAVIGLYHAVGSMATVVCGLVG